jgi:glucose/arabinose dehydrogenase
MSRRSATARSIAFLSSLLAVALVAGLAGPAAGQSGTPPVVVRGLASLTHLAAPASEPGRLYAVEQRGVIQVIERGRVRPQPFLDIRARISSGGERGLLSVAFHPSYAKNHRFYVNYTDTAGNTRVVEFRSNGRSAILSSARLVFYERQPYPNHNGGQLAFGPDGLLYIGMGDGGSGGDPNNYAQTFATKLGKLWKLNVNRRVARPQLVAYGLRNPWRFAFDRATGDLYVGDVGQGAWEEVDYVPRAQLGTLMNFGWSAYEGNEAYDSSRTLDPRGRLVRPLEVYSHDDGCSVTGGFVYRGKARPDLAGRYFYGDYCSGTVWSLRIEGGKAADVRTEGFRISGLTSFGEDARGGLYAVDDHGVVYRIAA